MPVPCRKADICTDGTPAGYGVYEVDGNKLTWRYKSAGYPIEHQFRAYPVGVSEDYPEYILANVWNWDENWKVEWYDSKIYACYGWKETIRRYSLN